MIFPLRKIMFAIIMMGIAATLQAQPPTLSSPPDSAEDISTTITLDWQEVTGAQGYHLQVATDSGFSSLVVEQSSLSSTEYTVENLDNSTIYYWRVRTNFLLTTSSWSDAWSFTTIIAPPAQPALSSPANGVGDQPQDLTFQWEAATRAESYQVQVSTSSDFSALVFNQSGVATTDYSVSGLQKNTTYYWRVRASNAGGTGEWSANWSFSTVELQSPPETPALIAPEAGDTLDASTVEFRWTSSTGDAVGYHIQVAENTAFSSVSYERTALTDTVESVSTLETGTSYYWRVRSTRDTAVSDWSEIRNFATNVMPPSTPRLVTPASGSTEISVTPTLTWQTAERAQSYTIQVSTSDQFTSTLVNSAGNPDTTFTPDSLEYATTFYWRVRASNSGGDSDWSTVNSFTTESRPSAPVQATLNSPADSAVEIPVAPEFSWYQLEEADSYHIQISKSASFETQTISQSGLTDTTYAASGLDSSTTYFWRVRGINDQGSAQWSAARRFTTVQYQLSAPVLLTPENGSTHPYGTVTFQWESVPEAARYHLTVDTSDDYTQPVISTGDLEEESFSTSALDGGTTYFWRINASRSGDTSAWSNTWSVTLDNPPLISPSLLAPADMASVQYDSVALEWEEISEADSYQLQVANDSLFSDIIIDTAGIAKRTLIVTGLAPNRTYWWHVRASRENGQGEGETGEWSESRQYKTMDTTTSSNHVSPPDGSVDQPTTLSLNWEEDTNANSYQVQVAADSTFSSTHTDKNGLSSSNYEVAGLEYSTTYYWRERSNYLLSTSSWSETWEFTTVEAPPAEPVLESPVSGSEGVSTTPTLEWAASARAESYEVQMDSSESFTNPQFQQADITETSITANTLESGTKYHWRVRGVNKAGPGNFSETWTFTTTAGDQPPAQPTLVFPEDGADSLSTTVNFQWNSIPNAENYHIQVGADSEFSQLEGEVDSVTNESIEIAGLPKETVLHWRVRAANANGFGQWSASRQFTTTNQEGVPAPPEIVSPADDSTNLPLETTLDWAPAEYADHYDLQVSTDSTFSTTIVSLSDVTSTQYPIQNLEYDTDYFWRVNASNQAGTSPWTVPHLFTTVMEAPTTPVLVAPEDRTERTSTTPELVWEQAERAENYRIQIGRDQAFNTTVLDSTNIDSTTFVPATLDSNTTYYWRVLARNPGGESNWSTHRQFTTISPGQLPRDAYVKLLQPDSTVILKAGETYTIEWESNYQEAVNILYSSDSATTWHTIQSNYSASSQFSWEVPDMHPETVRIKIAYATHPNVQEISAPISFYPKTIPVQITMNFPDNPSAEDYRLVGLPGNETIPVEDLLEGEPGIDWIVYRDTGDSTSYLQKYDGSDVFQFRAGLGFWILAKGGISLDRSISSVPLSESDTYTIPVRQGWNIISNPYSQSVDWEAVKQINQTEQPIWAYGNGYSESQVLQPYTGYYWYNQAGLDSLVVPYLRQENGFDKDARDVQRDPSRSIRIIASTDSGSNASVLAGMDVQVTQKEQSMVTYAPPPGLAPVHLSLIHPDSTLRYRKLTREIRPDNGSGQEFHLRLQTSSNEKIALRAQGNYDQETEIQLRLVNKQTGEWYDLKRTKQFQVVTTTGSKSYALLIGSKAFVEDRQASYLPKKITLSQNFPNPFNGQTTIAYVIPQSLEKSQVTIQIFNIMGQKVKTLVNTQKAPGRYQVVWNGANQNGNRVASGVYLYRLRINDQQITRKLHFIK
ncbi:MAG: fibronectin type III domain-containing protein [Candidatus Marinimicrobia bacterium]|nr:fibronectin type III domain-containing protein [Candidatus Neomarinimicrobiota bacterium]